jgi:hypothetical protein
MSTNNADLSNYLRKIINSHGHAFQVAVLRRAEELYERQVSKWVFEAAEMPVSVQGVSTRVDFILWQRRWSGQGADKFLVAECKRANPALSNWCFVKAPYIRRNPEAGSLIVDQVMKEGDSFVTSSQTISFSRDVYHLAYELRSDKQGNAGGTRGAIEEAFGQVLRGLNGLIQLFGQRPKDLLPEYEYRLPIVPAIFTTANLYVSEVDLKLTSLASGELPSDSVEVKSVPWLWYQYNMSPELKHTHQPGESALDLSHILERLYTRSVAVISPEGIDDFLSQENW